MPDFMRIDQLHECHRRRPYTHCTDHSDGAVELRTLDLSVPDERENLDEAHGDEVIEARVAHQACDLLPHLLRQLGLLKYLLQHVEGGAVIGKELDNLRHGCVCWRERL